MSMQKKIRVRLDDSQECARRPEERETKRDKPISNEKAQEKSTWAFAKQRLLGVLGLGFFGSGGLRRFHALDAL
jgi:hypothetical protein